MAHLDKDATRQAEKLCRMTAEMLDEMTRDEHLVVLHLKMLEATRTVKDHHLISELTDQVTDRVVARLRERNPDWDQ